MVVQFRGLSQIRDNLTNRRLRAVSLLLKNPWGRTQKWRGSAIYERRAARTPEEKRKQRPAFFPAPAPLATRGFTARISRSPRYFLVRLHGLKKDRKKKQKTGCSQSKPTGIQLTLSSFFAGAAVILNFVNRVTV